MWNVPLLVLVTLFYAAYNFLVKISSQHVAAQTTTTIVLTVTLQAAALAFSICFIGYLVFRGGHSFAVSTSAFWWAVGAGLAIGAAEVCYFYLFTGLGGYEPAPAAIVIPTVVSGTVVLSMIAGIVFLGEAATWRQWAGAALVVAGIALMFTNVDAGGAS
jgi:drug/metabolite transporter (DMT)-like permease